MSNFKKIALSLLLTMPMAASAAGIGIYAPINIVEREKENYSTADTFEYKPAAGFGLVYDTNVGENKIYNNRLSFEYHRVELDSINGQSINNGAYTYTKTKYNIINTFSFALFRNERLRSWIGPRLNVQSQSMVSSADSTYSRNDIGIGIAAATGVNVNLGNTVALAFDIDYHYVNIQGNSKRYNTALGLTETDHFYGTNEGVTARFYVLFRFGETFQKPAHQSANQGVIDQSL